MKNYFEEWISKVAIQIHFPVCLKNVILEFLPEFWILNLCNFRYITFDDFYQNEGFYLELIRNIKSIFELHLGYDEINMKYNTLLNIQVKEDYDKYKDFLLQQWKNCKTEDKHKKIKSEIKYYEICHLSSYQHSMFVLGEYFDWFHDLIEK